MNSEERLNTKLFSKSCGMAADVMEETGEAVKTWKSVTEVFEWAAKTFKDDWAQIDKDANRVVGELRSVKMSLNSEVKGCVQALRDLEESLAGDRAVARIQQLKELVDLCERFQKVKESGALDEMVEMLLKKL